MSLELNTRMNTEIRTAIKAKAFKTSGIEQAAKALVDKRAVFAEKVRQASLKACGVTDELLNERFTALMALNSTHQNGENGIGKFIVADVYRDRDRYLNVALNGQRRYFYLNGSENGEQTHIVVPKVENGGPWVNRYQVLLSDAELMDELIGLDAEAAELISKEKTFNNTLDAVLKNARTVKQLLTAWPEAKELLPEDMQRATGTALAINPAELNAICGIPTNK